MIGKDGNGNTRSADYVLADVSRFCKGCDRLQNWRYDIQGQEGMPYPECCPCNSCLFGKYGYGGKPDEAVKKHGYGGVD